MTTLPPERIRTDGGTQSRVELDWLTIDEYADAMRDGATFPPLVAFHDGADYWLADGFHRLEAAKAAGVEAVQVDVRQGTRRDAILYSVGANSAHGLRRTNADKRAAVLMLLNDPEWQRWSDPEIGRRTATSHEFVRKLRDLTCNVASDEPRIYTTKHGTVATMNTANIGRNGATPEHLCPTCGQTWMADLPYCPYCNHTPTSRIEWSNAERLMSSVPHVAFNSGNNEWYTPAEYIAAARAVMGGIDLDPASSPAANEVVQAARYYTQDSDGLLQPWQGCVWMNPPYASELIGKFCERLADAFVAGDVPEAIVLVNNATETSWFALLAEVASAVVFPRSRVRFWQPDGTTGAPLQGQAVIYLGGNPQAFLDSFGGFGWGAHLWH